MEAHEYSNVNGESKFGQPATAGFHLFKICWGDAASNFLIAMVGFPEPGMSHQLFNLPLLNYLSCISFCYVDDSKILKAIGTHYSSDANLRTLVYH